MDRIILHSDLNSFYASVECLYRPELRDKPVAVAGDPEARHGIILTAHQDSSGGSRTLKFFYLDFIAVFIGGDYAEAAYSGCNKDETSNN